MEENRKSNYETFKEDALKRLMTYDQTPLINRLGLKSDETYIYIPFCSREYRIHRQKPLMEYRNTYEGAVFALDWTEADVNAVLTICDLLCHTENPVVLSGTMTTLEGLNRVKGGSSTILGTGFFRESEEFFDQHTEEMKAACEKLGGVSAGKGDVAFRIPVFDSISLQISFYESDDEFPAKLTFFLDQDICSYLFYETLWYLVNLVLGMLKEIING